MLRGMFLESQRKSHSKADSAMFQAAQHLTFTHPNCHGLSIALDLRNIAARRSQILRNPAHLLFADALWGVAKVPRGLSFKQITTALFKKQEGALLDLQHGKGHSALMSTVQNAPGEMLVAVKSSTGKCFSPIRSVLNLSGRSFEAV